MNGKVAQHNVYYEEMGQGHPLLALHGFGVDHRLLTGCLEPVFAERPDWRRIYPDLPGMGQTGAAHWITSADDMLAMILTFIDEVIPEQTFVFSWAIVWWLFGAGNHSSPTEFG